MEQLKIHCFGYLKIEKDGKVITQFDTDKARALLVFLAIEGYRPLPRSYLAGLFWSDLSEKKALQSLRQTLSILRRVIGDSDTVTPFIISERDQLRINPNVKVWVDILEFKRLLNQAYQFYQNKEQFHRINFHYLLKSLQLREGAFLDKLSVSGAALFDEWVSLIREDLDHQAVEGLIFLAQYYQNRTDFNHAKQALQKILQITPWNESTHLLLMRLQAMEGKWSDVENQYWLLRKFLKDQIGVEPASDTIQFFNEVRKLRSMNSPLVFEALHQTNIKFAESNFIGREKEIDDITKILVDPACRLITIHGQGGIGKTSLALEIARQCIGAYCDGVFIIFSAGVQTKDEFISEIMNVIQVPLLESTNFVDRLRDYLRNKTMLLVVDNFEQLLRDTDTKNFLGEIVQNSLNVKLLITSRERLNIMGEWVYPLKGMLYPGGLDQSDIESAMKYDALALFQNRAKQIKPDFILNEHTIPAVIQICQMFEGLPLAIELAAADVWCQSCQMIADKISQNRNSLNTNTSNVLSRYNNLWSNLEGSWHLLDNQLQKFFISISIFEESFSIVAAKIIGLVEEDDLIRLVSQSLLQFHCHDRFIMHSVIRQFAREKLISTGKFDNVRVAYVNYYVDYLHELLNQIIANHQKMALDSIQIELQNLKKAWEWILQDYQIEKINTFMDPMYQFFENRNRYQEGIDFFLPALNLLDQNQIEELQDRCEILSAKLRVRIGSLAHRIRNNKIPRTYFKKAAQIFKKYGLDHELANCRTALASVYLRANEYAKAEDIATLTLDFYQKNEDIVGKIKSLNTLGLVNLRRGNLEGARHYLSQSVVLGQKSKINRELIVPLNYLGDIACNDGNYPEAIKLFQESFKIAVELEDLYQKAIVINNLASIYHVEQNFSKAREMYEKSLMICRQIGDHEGEVIALANLGEVALTLGDIFGAITLSEQGLFISREIGEEWSTSICLNNLADAYCKNNQVEKALIQIKEAIKIAWKNGAYRFLARFSVTAGRCFQLQGLPELANELFEAALAHSSTEYDIRQKAIEYRHEMVISNQPETDDERLCKLIQREFIV